MDSIYNLYIYVVYRLQADAGADAQELFDPATSKLGGVAILTIQLTIMAQLKKFFLINPRSKFFDLLNYPVAFCLLLPVLPPWPIYSWEAWGNYGAGSIALGTLASISAAKVRDPVSDEEKDDAALKNAEKEAKRLLALEQKQQELARLEAERNGS